MVLVEDVTEGATPTPPPNQPTSTAPPSQPAGTPPPPQASSAEMSPLAKFISDDKISALLFMTRLFSIGCTFLFIFPITGYDSNALYQKALMGSAATSALKLHQRMTGVPFQLNRAYFNSLTLEDSFHYLLYALIFLNNFPITIVLMPVVGFAILHVAAYAKTILILAGSQNSFANKIVDKICAKDKDIMRFVAVNEIILVPTIFVMIFAGKCGVFVPFIYYRFISMRYQSRRNPYNRMMFTELRLALEYYTNLPSCPQAVRNLTQRMIGLVMRMAPQQAA